MCDKLQNKPKPAEFLLSQTEDDKRGWNHCDELSTRIWAGTGARATTGGCPYGILI